MDQQTIETIHDDYHKEHLKEVIDLFEALKASGRLAVRDFDSDIEKYSKPVGEVIDYDMRNMELWATAFQESFDKWVIFCKHGQSILHAKRETHGLSDWEEEMEYDFHAPYNGMCAIRDVYYTGMLDDIPNALRNWRGKIDSQRRDWIREMVRRYFECINNVLCLCDLYDAALHDWADFEPLYRKKLDVSLRVSSSGTEGQRELRCLFELLFNDFAPKSAGEFVRALEDQRIEELRKLVSEAVAGDIDFDVEFASRTLKEALAIESKLAHRRRVTGWLTMPLGFIPWAGTILQKIGEETVSNISEKRLRREKGWFYLVSDIIS